jgi:hypothetical protein
MFRIIAGAAVDRDAGRTRIPSLMEGCAPTPDRCRRKIEMSPFAQSRDDTPGCGHTCAKRHVSQTQGEGEGVRGRSRRGRCAQRSP